jgi:hypothetical protein
LEIDTSKHTSIITQNIHKFYISIGTLDDIWPVTFLKKNFMRELQNMVCHYKDGERESQGEKVQKSQDLSRSASAEPQGSCPCVGLL